MKRLLVSVLKGINWFMRLLVGWTHFAQFAVQWGIKPRPEWFDHFLDQYWQWAQRTTACGSSAACFPGSSSKRIRGCSRSAAATVSIRGTSIRPEPGPSSRSISTRMQFRTPGDTIPRRTLPSKQDIRAGLPEGPFDNIVWDAAIEHFTEKEIDTIMGAIVERLGADGILSGYTLTEDKTGKKSNALHEYEFKDKEDLRRFFTPHFKFVRVWETIYPTRHNLYFVASQTPVEMYG